MKKWSPLCLPLLLAGCLQISDPVTLGDICLPATSSCSAQADLDRGTTLGRNSLDYQVTNTSTKVARVSLRAFATTTTTAPDAGPTTGPQQEQLAEQRVEVAPNASVKGRFVPRELGREPLFTLQAACESDCAVNIRYVMLNEPNECVVTEECSGGWLCDVTYGECVECLSNADCAEGKECTLGRCPVSSTQSSGGCTSTPNTPPSPWSVLALMLLMGVMRQRHKRNKAGVAGAILITSLVAIPTDAFAEDDKISTSISLGVGPRFWTGDLGANTERGSGVTVAQDLRWGWFGAGAKLHTSFFLTTPDTLPLSRELITYSVELGPRAYIDLPQDFFLTLGAGYERLGLASNSLVELTGTELSYHSATGMLGVTWKYDVLRAHVVVSYHHAFGLPGGMLMLNVMVGASGG